MPRKFFGLQNSPDDSDSRWLWEYRDDSSPLNIFSSLPLTRMLVRNAPSLSPSHPEREGKVLHLGMLESIIRISVYLDESRYISSLQEIRHFRCVIKTFEMTFQRDYVGFAICVPMKTFLKLTEVDVS